MGNAEASMVWKKVTHFKHGNFWYLSWKDFLIPAGCPEVFIRNSTEICPTWRMGDRRMRGKNYHGDHKSPADRVVGPLPNGLEGL